MNLGTSRIDLERAVRVGEGCRRVVYIHPGDASRCIKVVTPEARAKEKQQKAFAREVKSLQHYTRQGRNLEQVSRFHGLVPTSEGEGFVFDLIRGRGGEIAPTLQGVLESGRISLGECRGELEQLRHYLLREGIVLADLHPGNLVRQEVGEGDYRLVVIDGVGNNDFLGIADWLPFAWRRKIQRKWDRFLAGLEERLG